MKRILTLIFLLVFSKNSFCQVNLQGTEEHTLTFSLGMNETFINNPAFNSWTKLNFNKHEGYLMSGHADINLALNLYDFGLHVNGPYPYGVAAFYLGKRLTGQQSSISSFLNFDIGVFQAVYDDIAPLNYVLSPDQLGQRLQLRYYATYFGLSSKNYLNKLSFRTGKGKKAISYNSGFYFDFGYEPWGGDWRYGYYTGSGKTAVFKSSQGYGIPNLGNEFMDIGIFIGIGN